MKSKGVGKGGEPRDEPEGWGDYWKSPELSDSEKRAIARSVRATTPEERLRQAKELVEDLIGVPLESKGKAYSEQVDAFLKIKDEFDGLCDDLTQKVESTNALVQELGSTFGGEMRENVREGILRYDAIRVEVDSALSQYDPMEVLSEGDLKEIQKMSAAYSACLKKMKAALDIIGPVHDRVAESH